MVLSRVVPRITVSPPARIGIAPSTSSTARRSKAAARCSSTTARDSGSASNPEPAACATISPSGTTSAKAAVPSSVNRAPVAGTSRRSRGGRRSR